jgi:hypothetical protein
MGSLYALNVATCQGCRFAAHRQEGWASGSACTVDAAGRSFREIAKAGDCPKRLFASGGMPPAPAAAPKPAKKQWGPALWKRLHTATGDTAAVLASVTARVPCGDCKKHWKTLLEEMPPVHGDGWFEWTWRAHDRVNELLGKPRPTLEESRAIWIASAQSGR